MITDPRFPFDVKDAEKQFDCKLSVALLESMIREVREHYRTGVNFEQLLDAIVLNLTKFESQQHAYKQVLGKFFNRRFQKKRAEKKAGTM